MTAASAIKATAAFDVEQVRAQFPILQQSIGKHPLVYLDNGASTQKPQQVIDAISHFYANDYANVHRGIHTLSQRATDRFEQARKTVQQFINADRVEEIIFTSGTTEAINLVAYSYAREQLVKDDEILISAMEHHSNIVPWQLLAEKTGAKLRIIPVDTSGTIDLVALVEMLNEKSKMLAVTHVSNALGTINPIEEIIDMAHAVDCKVLIDGAQASAHLALDVQKLDCDFYAFSSHKAYGPTGIGALYGKYALLENMRPYQAGGEMIKEVSFEAASYNDLPHKFEAGTPNIVGAVGFAAALDFIQRLDKTAIHQYEQSMLQYATERILKIEGVRIVGTAENKTSILSFVVEGAHATDIGTLLDQQGVAIRVGHHCAMPLMHRFGLTATARASFAMYNTFEDVDRFIAALEKSLSILKP